MHRAGGEDGCSRVSSIYAEIRDFRRTFRGVEYAPVSYGPIDYKSKVARHVPIVWQLKPKWDLRWQCTEILNSGDPDGLAGTRARMIHRVIGESRPSAHCVLHKFIQSRLNRRKPIKVTASDSFDNSIYPDIVFNTGSIIRNGFIRSNNSLDFASGCPARIQNNSDSQAHSSGSRRRANDIRGLGVGLHNKT